MPLSGGIDSAVAAAIAKKEGYELYFLTCAYGQKNLKKEMENAKKLAEKMGVVEHKIVNMGWLGELGNSIITDKDINDKQNDHLIYVPYRNTVILSACIAWAEVLGAEAIFTGSEAGPWICPDNSPEYYEKLNELIKVSTKLVKNLKVYAPLNYSNKEDDVRKGIELGVPFEYTWTCVTIRMYNSQKNFFDYAFAIRGLNQYRGAISHLHYAEAFLIKKGNVELFEK